MMTEHLEPYPESGKPVSRLAQWADRRTAWLFAAPGVLCLALVTAYPVVYNILTSFTDRNLMYRGAHFIGFGNYLETLRDPVFAHALVNSCIWTFGSVLGQLALGLAAALALDRITHGKRVLRLVLTIPWAFPAIVLAFGCRFMLDGIYGVLNHLLLLAGLVQHPEAWLARPDFAMPIVVLINIWFGFPFMMLAISAGLAAIPADLFEAARIDGATPWQETWHIRLPLIMPILAALVVLRTIWTFNNFDLIYLITGGGPVDATMTLPVYALTVGWQRFDLGRMSAISVLMIMLLVVIIWLYTRLANSQFEREKA